MSLTREQITAGATYIVRLDQSNSFKRRNDALKLVKGIGQRPETSATYDGTTQAWTVTLPADSVGGLRDLQVLAHAYDADVELATESEPQAPAAQPARETAPRQRTSAWGRAAGLAEREDGNGYTRSERDAMGH